MILLLEVRRPRTLTDHQVKHPILFVGSPEMVCRSRFGVEWFPSEPGIANQLNRTQAIARARPREPEVALCHLEPI